MFGGLKSPSDPFKYAKSADSTPLSMSAAVGRYVFVVDDREVIHVAPDGLHVHPRVLGNALPALYAGELSIDRPGNVDEVTNLSGTFRFGSKRSLCCVAAGLRGLGFTVGDVVWFPPHGGTRPVVLVCP